MSDSSISMMDGTYFVGRKDILDWLNNLLKLNLQKIEDTASGAVACHVADAIFPNTVPMHKVNFEATQEYQYIENYKILQSVFTRHNVQKRVPVESLVKGKYQDNLEFLQWLKRFFELNFSGEEYNASQQRKGCRGEEAYFPAGLAASISSIPRLRQQAKKKVVDKENRSPNAPDGVRYQLREEKCEILDSVDNSASEETNNTMQNANDVSTEMLMDEWSELREQLSAEVDDRLTDNVKLKFRLDAAAEERDFYFERLRQLEEFAVSVVDGGVDAAAEDIVFVFNSILDRLYEPMPDAHETDPQPVTSNATYVHELGQKLSEEYDEEASQDHQINLETEMLPELPDDAIL